MEPDTFDIRTGMDVYGADGQKIGRVKEIDGFGAARVPGFSDRGVAQLVTQAKTGSGYFKVDRQGALGQETGPLCVPFRGIRDIVPEHGVVLTDTILEELGHQQDPRSAKQIIAPLHGRRWLPRWMGG